METINFLNGSSVGLIKYEDEVEYYMDGHKITNKHLIYEIEQCIDNLTGDED